MIYAYCLSLFSMHFFSSHSIAVSRAPCRTSSFASSTSRPEIAPIPWYCMPASSPPVPSPCLSSSKADSDCLSKSNYYHYHQIITKCLLVRGWSPSIKILLTTPWESPSTINREEWKRSLFVASISFFLVFRSTSTTRWMPINLAADSKIGDKGLRMQCIRRCLTLWSQKDNRRIQEITQRLTNPIWQLLSLHHKKGLIMQ